MHNVPKFSNTARSQATSGFMFKNCILSCQDDSEGGYTALKDAKTPAEMLVIIMTDDFALMQFSDWSVRGALKTDFSFVEDEYHCQISSGETVVVKRGDKCPYDSISLTRLRSSIIASYAPHFDDICALCQYLSINHPGLAIDSVCHNIDYAIKFRFAGTLVVHHHVDKKKLVIETDTSLAGDTFNWIRGPISHVEAYEQMDNVEVHRFQNIDLALDRIFDFIGADRDNTAKHETSTETMIDEIAEENREIVGDLQNRIRADLAKKPE